MTAIPRLVLSPRNSDPGSSASRSSASSTLGLLTENYRISSLYTDNPYGETASGRSSIAHKFAFPADPRLWGSEIEGAEADDSLHAPEAKRPHRIWSQRGLLNAGCLFILCAGIISLFAVYPILHYVTTAQQSSLGGYNLGGINASGQIPLMPGNWGLIDNDTPKSAYTKSSWNNGPDMELVFSDEFNVDGRTFYPGDDPYWEAVDLHYWETNNMEWYDPAAITTEGGSLVVTLSQKETHGLNYQGGMMATWNKFCFTGGYIETSVELPGLNNVVGLWPAIWTMGNLGRAGYGASLEGLWPYTYDACDVGTAPNQTFNGQPVAATIDGDPTEGGALSFLPGQRLSRCTCSGESHPGPKHSDGTFVGRSAPEIDIFEAQISAGVGQVSQSAQWAPFDPNYQWKNTSDNEVIADPSISTQNTFLGTSLQQATSVVTTTNQECYEGNGGCYSVYGFEYKPGFDGAYITWVSDNKVAWTLNAAGMGADPTVQISARPVPQEPMYIIVNLGMSTNFGAVDIAHIPFPVHMRVDYIRVYQPTGQTNIGCNPTAYPTESYINQYLEAYSNPNLTTWTGDYGQPWPKNSFLGQC